MREHGDKEDGHVDYKEKKEEHYIEQQSLYNNSVGYPVVGLVQSLGGFWWFPVVASSVIPLSGFQSIRRCRW